jgi:hypothetical protein
MQDSKRTRLVGPVVAGAAAGGAGGGGGGDVGQQVEGKEPRPIVVLCAINSTSHMQQQHIY